MKHFRKVCSVLLAVLMLAVALPMYLTFEAPEADAAEVGVVENGDFSSYESYTGGSGQTAYRATGWTVRDWGVTMGASGQSGKGVQLSKDSSHAGATSLTQVVPVNTNATYTFSFYAKAPKTDCDYVACFTYSLDLGTTSGDCSTSLVDQATVNPGGTSWKQFTYTVNTGSNKYLKIRFISTGVGSGDSYLDTVALAVVNAGDTGTHAKPALKSFTTEKNRPNSDSNNVIIQPGFEATTNAQWNTSAFLTNGVSHVTGDAAGAHSGSGYLKYYRGSVAPGTWSQFAVDLPSAGEYVFSAWVRTPELSANNKGVASIGILDEDTGKFLTYGTNDDYYGHYSTPEIQIRSTATDNDWHLRAVTFYVGGASTIHIAMYGLSSEMYVDDISIHLLTNGVTYSGDQKGSLSVSSTSVTNKYCESEDNLIPDCNMNGSTAVDFWSQSSGWNNGFLEFNTDGQSSDHGTVLHYKGANPGSDKLYRYVKFIYVEPNTSYTVSFDYRVVSAGNQLMFIDNNIEKNAVFHTPSLGSASNSWKTYAFTFNTGNYNRIGIVFQDHASAEAYFDDFRFFKTSDGISEEPVEEVYPTLKHNKGEDNDVLESRMEMDNNGKYGLAFLFNLEVSGATRVEWDKDNTAAQNFVADFTNAQVDAFETGEMFKLIKAGAVVTNQESIGQDESTFDLDHLTGNTVVDVPGNNSLKLFYTPENDVIHYAIRIVNIPESAKGTTIYVRPYYVFEYKGEQIVVYGDIVYDSYEKIPDINDGWLEWD